MNYEQLTFATIMLPTDDGVFKVKGAGIDELYIEQILRYGSNTENARKLIVSEFSKGKSDYTDYLKDMYHGGFGIQTSDGVVSVEYGDMVIFRQGSIQKKLTWQDVQQRIEALLEEGRFAFQNEIDGAYDCELREIAERVSYIIMDTTADIWPGLDMKGGYPDLVERVIGELKKNPGKIAGSLCKILELQANGEKPLRFPRLHRVNEMLTRVTECGLLRRTYKSVLDEESVQMVITDYEINRALGAGSGVSGGKQRIKELFAQESDKSKRIEFLKREYGIGGHSHAVSGANHSGENHDGRGIELVKGDCKVMMNWSQVERRLDRLIKENRYG